MDIFEDEEYVQELLGYCTKVCKKMTDLYLEAGMDVIAIVDPLVSQVSAKHFESILQVISLNALTISEARVLSRHSSYVEMRQARSKYRQKRESQIITSIDENVDLAEVKR